MFTKAAHNNNICSRVRTLITSNPHDVRFNSLFLFTQINSSLLELRGFSGRVDRGRKSHLISDGSSFLRAGVIAPARDRDRDLGDRVELVSEALEARTYFLVDAIVGPKSRDIIGAGGADGAVSISSYAGGGPRSEMP